MIGFMQLERKKGESLKQFRVYRYFNPQYQDSLEGYTPDTYLLLMKLM